MPPHVVFFVSRSADNQHTAILCASSYYIPTYTWHLFLLTFPSIHICLSCFLLYSASLDPRWVVVPICGTVHFSNELNWIEYNHNWNYAHTYTLADRKQRVVLASAHDQWLCYILLIKLLCLEYLQTLPARLDTSSTAPSSLSSNCLTSNSQINYLN